MGRFSDALTYLDDLQAGRRRAWSLGIGASVDARCGGLEPEHLNVIGASAKDGKTTLGVNVSHALLNKQDEEIRLLVFTTETSRKWFLYKLGCRQFGISATDLRMAECSEDEYRKIKQTVLVLQDWDWFHVVDNALLTPYVIEKEIAEFGPNVVVLDHFHKIDTEGEDVTRGFRRVAQQLKTWAVDYKCSLLALSQVTYQDKWCTYENGEFVYDAFKMKTEYTKELHSQADKLMFFHNVTKQMPSFPNRGHLLYHSMRDYPSEGYSKLYTDIDHQYINADPPKDPEGPK